MKPACPLLRLIREHRVRKFWKMSRNMMICMLNGHRMKKVAMEAAIGASMSGVRSFAAMKMVGVNVAADPLLTFAYLGINGGFAFVSADDPGMHSSQNEQDNRNYAKFAKIAMFEPSDSQECIDMTKEAYKVSETYGVPVMIRMTTRVCHSKSLVEEQDRQEVPPVLYQKQREKWMPYQPFPRNAAMSSKNGKKN